MTKIHASKDATEKAKRFSCPALRSAIKDKEIAEVMSNELMATIRNNTYIPEDKRYKLIDQINSKTKQETEMKKQFQEIEKSLNCPITEDRIAGMTSKENRIVKRISRKYNTLRKIYGDSRQKKRWS